MFYLIRYRKARRETFAFGHPISLDVYKECFLVY